MGIGCFGVSEELMGGAERSLPGRLFSARGPYMKRVIFETHSLTVSIPEGDDAVSVMSLLSSEICDNLLTWSSEGDLEEILSRITNTRSKIENRLMFGGLLCLKNREVPIGWLGITKDELSSDAGEIGYWLGENFHGRGFIRELLPKFIVAGMSSLNLSKLIAKTRIDNHISKRILLKNGFTYISDEQIFAPMRSKFESWSLFELEKNRVESS